MRAPGRRIILWIDTRLRGGAEEHLLSLAKSLPQKGWSCEVSMPANDSLRGLAQELGAAGASVHLRTRIDAGTPLLGRRGWAVLAGSLAYLAARRPRLVHFVLPVLEHSRLAVLASALIGIPFVLGFRLAERMKLPSFNLRLYRWLAARRSAWLALSGQNRAVLSQVFGLPPSRFVVVHNGIDCERFRAARSEREAARIELRGELGLDENARIVLGVGRIEARKGFGYFAAAAPRVGARHPDAHFLWAGQPPEGPDRELRSHPLFRGIMAAVREAEDRVAGRRCLHLLGHREDIERVLNASDVFVLPTLAEGQPRSLLEAMAAGLPAVVTRGAGLSEIITHEREGLLVPSRSAEALAQAVDRLLGEPGLAKEMGRLAALRAESFDLRVMTEKISRVYERLLAQGS